jgi:hypothetical protein
VPATEHPRQVAVIFPDKNFTPPGWVPTNFSNESSPIRGNQFHRPAEGQRCAFRSIVITDSGGR